MQKFDPFKTPGDGLDQDYEYSINHGFSPWAVKKSRVLAAIIPCLAGIGCVYQTFASLHDLRVYTPSGRLAKIDYCL